MVTRLFNGFAGPSVPTLGSTELRRLLEVAPEPPCVLDGRTPQEFAAGHIPGARLVPLPHLPDQMHTLPRDRLVVTACRPGHRSLVAAGWLHRAGFFVKNLERGMLGWSGPVVRPRV